MSFQNYLKNNYLRCLLATALSVLAAAGQAQTSAGYPSRPIRIIVGFTPGGAVDFVARLVGQKLNDKYGQPVVVENRPGASTTIGTERAAVAAPDGYTLLLIPPSTVVQSAIRKNLPYNLTRDFASVSQLSIGPFALVVHPSMPVKSVKELIAYAREHPGKLTVGVPGMGSANHLAGELFARRALIKVLHVPYKGSGEAVVALAAGQTLMSMPSMASVIPLIEGGKVRALAVSSVKRSSALPNTPTIDEAGVAGYSYFVWYGVNVPTAVPRPIINQLNGAFGRILQMPDVREAFARQGMEPQHSTPGEFAALIAREIEQTVKLMQLADIKAE